MNGEPSKSSKPWYRERAGMVLLGFFAIAGFFVLTEHWAHIVPWLPWAFLLACPLMHMFMHRGHGGHSAHHDDAMRGDGQPPARGGGNRSSGERTP